MGAARAPAVWCASVPPPRVASSRAPPPSAAASTLAIVPERCQNAPQGAPSALPPRVQRRARGHRPSRRSWLTPKLGARVCHRSREFERAQAASGGATRRRVLHADVRAFTLSGRGRWAVHAGRLLSHAGVEEAVGRRWHPHRPERKLRYFQADAGRHPCAPTPLETRWRGMRVWRLLQRGRRRRALLRMSCAERCHGRTPMLVVARRSA